MDAALASVLTLLTFVVHDVPYLLTAPFWTDEAWVAISTRLPLSELPRITASTPVGWSLLLRLVVVGGPERLRLVPLLFAAATVAAAYWYGRTLPWPRLLAARIAGVLTGVAALLLPSALYRDDLKQYTADAFVTVLLLGLTTRVGRDSRHPPWRALLPLAVTAVVGFLFSAVAVFVLGAVLASIGLTQLVARRWADAARTAAVGAGAAVPLLAVFVLLYRPGMPQGLTDYWSGNYLPLSRGPAAVWRFVAHGIAALDADLGTGPVVLTVLLVSLGVLTVVRLGRPDVALVVPVLLVELLVLGAVRQYPLFNLRTSHFALTALAVTAAVGVAGACLALSRWRVQAALVCATVAIAFFTVGVRHLVHGHPLPHEDVRTPVQDILALRRPGDVVVVNSASNWGFAYYWPIGRPVTAPSADNLQGFVAVFPDQPDILLASDTTPETIDATLNAARTRALRHPGGRIWLVHEHMHADQVRATLAWEQLNAVSVQTVGSLDLVQPNR
ncbi:hypothetical protein GCM10011594_18300 [Nakamurella endophytica]|uniref:Uncharacterized protein n=1 Tax=Nakamurella endophytica TaxID=1748367 RepID=A0A917SVN9_9ACTN|nr:hypothetical protein GCM10011594_18300 [Nakamurella endophytica]